SLLFGSFVVEISRIATHNGGQPPSQLDSFIPAIAYDAIPAQQGLLKPDMLQSTWRVVAAGRSNLPAESWKSPPKGLPRSCQRGCRRAPAGQAGTQLLPLARRPQW